MRNNSILIERLSKDILEDIYFENLFLKASILYAYGLFKYNEVDFKLSEKEYFHLLRFADILSISSNPKARNKAYQIISILNYSYKTDPSYRTYSLAVFAKLGNFPAINYLKTEDQNMAELPFDRTLEREVKEIIQAVPDTNELIFTDIQYKLFTELTNSKLFSFSGPTSMGKSFIIKSFIRKAISNKPPENIVIVVPTRALINQFAIDLMDELKEALDEFKYKVITNSNVTELSDYIANNYIFVLTPERLISYLSQKNNPSLGYIFVDEAHKIAAEKDIRSVTSYTAIEKILKKFPNINLYFASPNVSNPEIFLNLFNKEATKFFYTIESPVSQNLFFINLMDKSLTQYIDDKPYKLKSDLLNQFNETNEMIKYLGSGVCNIIYCNSKNLTIQKSFEFYTQLKKDDIKVNDEVKRAIKHIKNYIHKDYYLATFLEVGIAYHFGNLPQIIRNIVENLYRKEYIQYIFCTSTLLEGINMPAKNIFILINKKGTSTFTPIDFWNLAGRAGRLKLELSGNIYCIKDNEKTWKEIDILEKKDITLEPTVSSRIDKNLKKIESLLLNKDIKGTEKEKEILKYIANIICIDTMEIDTTYQSPLIQQLIENNKNEIIKYAKEKTNNLEVPLSVLSSNQSINIGIQNKVYKILSNKKKNPSEIKLPNKIDFETCLRILNDFYNLYEWKQVEKDFKSEESLRYYALLMNKWMNGLSLNQIIIESITYYDSKNLDFYIDHNNVGKFDKNNIKHINELINNIIEDIEKKLRFILEKYFNHYYLILSELVGEDNAGANWAQILEYGTQNRLIIALQNLGLSRHSSDYLYKKHKSCLIIENNKLKGINGTKLFSQIDKESIEYEELKAIIR